MKFVVGAVVIAVVIVIASGVIHAAQSLLEVAEVLQP